MKNYAFKTKEEYLQYRKDWKEEYKELSETIRELKWLRTTRCQSYSHTIKDLRKPDRDYYWKLIEGVKNYLNDIPQYVKLVKKYFGDKPYWIEGEIVFCKGLATSMLEELKMAKEKAQKQYQETKNLTPC